MRPIAGPMPKIRLTAPTPGSTALSLLSTFRPYVRPPRSRIRWLTRMTFSTCSSCFSSDHPSTFAAAIMPRRCCCRSTMEMGDSGLAEGWLLLLLLLLLLRPAPASRGGARCAPRLLGSPALTNEPFRNNSRSVRRTHVSRMFGFFGIRADWIRRLPRSTSHGHRQRNGEGGPEAGALGAGRSGWAGAHGCARRWPVCGPFSRLSFAARGRCADARGRCGLLRGR